MHRNKISQNNINIRQAAVLCGGLGSRLGNLTLHSPKPMMEIDGHPFLFHLLEQLSDQGIKRFLLMTGYLGERIQEYFGDGSEWGWEIDYSSGPKEWDTCRRIFEAKELIDDRFILLYSDNFINLNLFALDQASINGNAPLTLSLVKKESGFFIYSCCGEPHSRPCCTGYHQCQDFDVREDVRKIQELEHLCIEIVATAIKRTTNL